jgi:anti-anti-sigma factor
MDFSSFAAYEDNTFTKALGRTLNITDRFWGQNTMISVNTDNNFVISVLEDTISINNADNLRNDLKKAIAANPGMDIVIDMSHVNFIDSSGIAMFVNFVHTITGPRRKMSMINLAPLIKNTIKQLNLTKFLNAS